VPSEDVDDVVKITSMVEVALTPQTPRFSRVGCAEVSFTTPRIF
jgi:hypothetical protein